MNDKKIEMETMAESLAKSPRLATWFEQWRRARDIKALDKAVEKIIGIPGQRRDKGKTNE